MLSCTHEFCKQCIEGIAQFQSDGSIHINCPMRCEQKTVLSKTQTIGDLSASYNFKNLLQALTDEDEDADVGPSCSFVKKCKHKRISTYCCCRVMCDSCHVKHLNNKSKDTHNKVDLRYNRKDSKLAVVCKHHDMCCTLMCSEDRELLCKYCEHRQPQHKNHTKIPIDVEVHALRETLRVENNMRKRRETFEKVTRQNIADEKERFRWVIQQRRNDCLQKYNSLLDSEEERLTRLFDGFCEMHIRDVYTSTTHLPSPTIIDEMIKKYDVEVLLQRDDILEMMVRGLRSGVLSTETISFHPSNGEYLSDLPLGAIASICDDGVYLSKRQLKPTIVCDYGETLSQTAITSGDEAATKMVEDESTPDYCSSEAAQALKSLGNGCIANSQYDKAVSCYSKAIQYCPESNTSDLSKLYHNRAVGLDGLKEWQMVIEDCTEALKLNPHYVKALQRRARAFDQMNKKLNTKVFTRKAFEDAIAGKLMDSHANRMKDKAGLVTRLTNEYGQLLADSYAQDHDHILPSKYIIQPILDNFNYTLRVFVSDVEPSPTDDVHDLHSCILNEEYENMIPLSTELIQLDSRYKNRALVLRGTIHFIKNDVHSALEDINTALSGFKKSEDDDRRIFFTIDALMKRACLKHALRDVPGMEADLSDALQLDVNNAAVYHHRAMLHFQIGKPQEALKDYSKAIELDPGFVAPRLNLAETMYAVARSTNNPSLEKEADKIFNEANNLFPANFETRRRFGEVLYKHSRTEEALAMFDLAIALSPEQPQAYVDKARLLMYRRLDWQGAEESLKKAIAADERNFNAYALLGQLKLIESKYEEAIQWFEKSIPLTPLSSDLLRDTFGSMEDCKMRLRVIKEHKLVAVPISR